MFLSFGNKTQKAGCWQYLAERQRSDLWGLSPKTNIGVYTRSARESAEPNTCKQTLT